MVTRAMAPFTASPQQSSNQLDVKTQMKRTDSSWGSHDSQTGSMSQMAPVHNPSISKLHLDPDEWNQDCMRDFLILLELRRVRVAILLEMIMVVRIKSKVFPMLPLGRGDELSSRVRSNQSQKSGLFNGRFLQQPLLYPAVFPLKLLHHPGARDACSYTDSYSPDGPSSNSFGCLFMWKYSDGSEPLEEALEEENLEDASLVDVEVKTEP
ncbi:hypothetical protein LR48_Vigan348s000200 [Vigna angularis]|uniref:Uncharacterized protein n=1 Tax=Phaseolus angularis TaxID=3914 RepID=A0A0L9T8Q4_PHAAN|nr:hypothetical protein LR48_Vigan348s000200 [Vigna angularis]